MKSKLFLRNNHLGSIEFLSLFIFFLYGACFFLIISHAYTICSDYFLSLSLLFLLPLDNSFSHCCACLYFFNDGLCFTGRICCVNLDMELSLLETCELGGGYTVEDKDSLFSDSEDNMSKYYL